MGVEIIKDSQGSERIVLQSTQLYNDANIGNELENYEIIKILSEFEEKENFVSKVLSKNNSKIYALKKIGSQYIDYTNENIYEKLKQDFEKINKMKNVTKYYTYIPYNNDIYLLYEFVENEDLKGFIDAYEINKEPIEPDLLWNIFIQCLNGLKYLHENGLFHKNIKLTNIFMDDNKGIKLGDFGFDFGLENFLDQNDEYKCPELLENCTYKYDEKCDIYSMGVTFKKMCYFAFGEEDDDEEEKEEKVKEYYGEEMVSLIKKMLNEDPSLRPSSKDLYDSIILKYINNYAKLSSINSLFHCIYSFSNLTYEMNKRASSFNEEKTPISFYFYNCIKAFMENKDYENYAVYLNKFRELFQVNIKIDNDIEITPKLILEFFLEKINKETNDKQNGASFGIQKIEFNSDENLSLKKFNEDFNKNYNSMISQFFIGKLLTNRICQSCKKSQYSYTVYPFIEFNMEKCKETPNMEDWFFNQGKLKQKLYLKDNVICDNCKQSQEHIENKQFGEYPQNFIISLNWGEIEPYSLNIPDMLNIKENNNNSRKFNLVAIVKRLKDEKDEEFYVAIYKDKHQWMISIKKEINKCDNVNNIEGIPLLLFYERKIDIGL